MARLRPIKGFVLLVDDPAETVENGVVVRLPESGWRTHMDYTVAACHDTSAYGVGDRVVLRHPNAGRSISLDGIPHRLVRDSEIEGVIVNI